MPDGVALPSLNAPWMATLAAFGVVLGAVYMLRMYQRVMFGPVRHAENRLLGDLNLREWAAVAPLLLLALWMGIFPKPFLSKIEPAAARYVQRLGGGPIAAPAPRAVASHTASAVTDVAFAAVPQLAADPQPSRAP